MQENALDIFDSIFKKYILTTPTLFPLPLNYCSENLFAYVIS